MQTFHGETFAEAYKDSLTKLFYTGKDVQSDGDELLELTNISITVNDPTMWQCSNAAVQDGSWLLAAELLWQFSGRKDLAFFEDLLRRGPMHISPAYGNTIFTERIPGTKINQYGWATEQLVLNPGSLRAVMHIAGPEQQQPNVRDFVRIMHVNHNTRGGKLHITVHATSSDAIDELPFDIAFFSLLQVQMWKHMLEFLPEMKIGSLTYVTGSYHVQADQAELVERMLIQEFNQVRMPTLRNNLIHSNGVPTTDLLNVMREIESPSQNELIFQEDDDVLYWIWGKLQVEIPQNV